MPNYVSLHNHTDLSLLDSATKTQEYIDKCLEYGQKALAITNHGYLKNWCENKMLCDKAGIKYIHGVETYITKSLLQNVDGEYKKVRDNMHCILLAKNYDGVMELNQLISRASDENHFYFVPRISADEFCMISNNIITLSACLAGPLNKLDPKDPKFEPILKRMDYLEIQPHNCMEQRDYNIWLASLADDYGKPLVATTDAHSSNKYKDECRDVLMLYKGQHYESEDEFDLVYKSYDEMVNAFTKQDSLPDFLWREALENTNRIADSIEEFELDFSMKYPILYGSPEADEEAFKRNVWNGLEDKLKKGIIPKEEETQFREDAENELKVFSQIGMAGFMQAESELIKYAKSEDMPIGFARGSVAGSRCAYLTDIIDLDPVRWGTDFYRFANSDRVVAGDIDVDCRESDRPKIFKHIAEKFGQEKVARVSSYGTLQEKGTIKLIVGALDKRYKAEHGTDTSKYTLKYAEEIIKDYEADPLVASERYKEVFYYFDGLVGTYISQSFHPAGIIISPVTLPDHYGTFIKDGEVVLNLDMDSAHDVNLIKFDMLVLRNIDIIYDTCKLAGIPYPQSYKVDWDDQDVWADMIKSPVGVFQMEGKFAHEMLSRYEPHSIYDMSLVTACIRPSGASYRDRVMEHKPNVNPTELIDGIFKESLGYCVYQEQVISFLRIACGFPGSKADTVRRAIADKDPAKLESMMDDVIDGYCSLSDKPREEAENEVRDFVQVLRDASGYSFSYNHSVAYSMIGYVCAYLRKYYPYEFLVSLLNNAANEDDVANAKALASQLHIKILPPKYGVSSDTYTYDKEKKEIVKGASDIKYVGKKVAKALYNMAHDGKNRTFVDIILDSKANIRDMNKRRFESLIRVDYFNHYGNITELSRILRMVEMFKYGEAKSYPTQKVTDSLKFIEKYATNLKKDGTPGSSYKFFSQEKTIEFLRECEALILSLGLPDATYKVKAENQKELMGYIDLVTGEEKDLTTLYVMDCYGLPNKYRGGIWIYKIKARSIGSGKENSFDIAPDVMKQFPIDKGSVIKTTRDWVSQDKKGYWKLYKYEVIE